MHASDISPHTGAKALPVLRERSWFALDFTSCQHWEFTDKQKKVHLVWNAASSESRSAFSGLEFLYVIPNIEIVTQKEKSALYLPLYSLISLELISIIVISTTVAHLFVCVSLRTHVFCKQDQRINIYHLWCFPPPPLSLHPRKLRHSFFHQWWSSAMGLFNFLLLCF